MRVITIDYGRVRTGLAITDLTKTIAYPFKTIQTAKTHEKTVENILNALKDYIDEIEIIIVGLPISLKGKDSQMAIEIKSFVKILKTKTKILIEFYDERLSSIAAERHLKDNLKLNRKKRSKIVDPIAAAILLQNYLDSK